MDIFAIFSLKNEWGLEIRFDKSILIDILVVIIIIIPKKMIFTSGWQTQKSPSVLVFSWVHWDEVSGIEANKKLAKQIISWKIKVISWKITLVLEANEQAVKQWIREVKANMNRLFLDWLQNTCYEENRAKELMKLIKNSDYLLDLHSTSWPSIPFAYAEENSLDLAKQVWIRNIISWWWALSEQEGNNNIAWDSENYMNKNWWQAITFEAWNHHNPDWTDISYKILLNFLATLWVIDNKYYKEVDWEKTHTKITWYYTAQSDNFKYSIETENFMKIKKWTEIWIDWDTLVIAQEDMTLIMPKKEDILQKWIEVFFIWK